MKRLFTTLTLCVPLAGLAIAGDGSGLLKTPVIEIRVSAAEYATCRQTLEQLEQRAVYTDGGTWLPPLLGGGDDAETVCVIKA